MTEPRAYWLPGSGPIEPPDQAGFDAWLAGQMAAGRTERTDKLWNLVTMRKPIPSLPLPLGPSETGIDWSHWNNGGQVIDFSKVRAAGHRYGWGKRTQGVSGVDPLGAANFNAAVGKLDWIGNYHFFEWAQDGTEQADHFSLTVGEASGNLADMLDCELKDGEDPASIDRARATLNLRKWLAQYAVRYPTKPKPILYTNKRSWEAMFTGVDDIARTHRFMIADLNDPLDLPNGVLWADFRQKSWTHRIEGQQGDFDLDEYRGDPPPVTAKHTMSTLTGQQVINLYYHTAGDSYDWLNRAGILPVPLTTAWRVALYTGLAIEDQPLTGAEKAALIAALST